MITKSQLRLIKSLQEKKNRNELGLFIVEGEKSVHELLNSGFEIDYLFLTKYFFNKYKKIITEKNIKHDVIDQEIIENISSFESNDSAVAIVKQINLKNPKFEINEIVIALDEVRDPGNFGTIIRIADWYGIKKIIATENSVDFYNPKVISASMGSFTRVQVFYANLKELLSKSQSPILGAFLDSENIHNIDFPKGGVLLMGNESKGISKEIEKFISKKITIPRYGNAESLNVAVATAVILDNWRNFIS